MTVYLKTIEKNIFIKIIVVVLVIVLIVGVYFIKQSVASNNTDTNSIDLSSNKKAVKMINFVAPDCVACYKMEGLMQEIMEEYKEIAQIYQVDVMENQQYANAYNIMYTPTQIFFDEDGNEIERHEGFIGKKDLVEKLADLGVKK